MIAKSTKRQPSSLLTEVSFAVLSLAFAYFIAVAPGFFSPVTWGMDDAAMYLRYLKNFEAGYGLAWNRGEGPVYGLTSLLYFAALFVVHGLTNLDDQLLLVGSSWAFGLLGLLMLVAITREMSAGFPKEKVFLLMAFVAGSLAFHPYFRYLALNGMESTLAVCASSAFVLGILQWVKRQRIADSVLLGFLGYALFLARPDCLVYALLTPVFFSFRIARGHRARPLGLYFLSLTLLLLADAGAKTWIFGDPLPLPFYVKQQGFYADFGAYAQWESGQFLLQFLFLVLPLILLGLFYLRRESGKDLLCWLFPVIIHFAYLSSVIQIMGYFGRLYLPALPFIIGWVVSGALVISKERGFSAFSLLRALTMFVVGLAIPWLVLTQRAGEPEVSLGTHRYPVLGWHGSTIGMYRVLRSLPDSVSLAATEHGFLGAQFPARMFFDLSGLHNKGLAKEGFHVKQLLSAEPALIWFPPRAYHGMREVLLHDADFASAYCVVPDLFDFGIAVRNDAVERGMIVEALKREAEKAYPAVAAQLVNQGCF